MIGRIVQLQTRVLDPELRALFKRLENEKYLYDELVKVTSRQLWELANGFPHSTTACWSWQVLEERNKVEWTEHGAWFLHAQGSYPQMTFDRQLD